MIFRRSLSPLPRRWPAVVLALVLAGLLGCEAEPQIATTSPAARGKQPDSDNLKLALDSLRQLASGAETQSAQRTVFYLNQWISSAEPVAGKWQPDRLVENLPRALRGTPGLEKLDRLEFDLSDMAPLQQALWLHDVADRVRREPPPPAYATWFKQVEKSVGLPEAEQLAAAERVFDWTVRNIQLDPLPPPPKGPVATAGSGTDPVSPAAQGIVGPGYAHLPLQTLLYGQGDAHERARIFILLARQLEIDAVMLAFIDEESPAPRGWIPAAAIGNELYLFETALGMPLPGPKGKGIATLSQVVAEPQLLEQLDVEGIPYAVQPQQLKSLVALIDAEPSALARRMQLLEEALPRGQRLALTVAPSDSEKQLRQNKSIAQVSLWRAPFEALLYPMGQMQTLQADPAALAAWQEREAVFAAGLPLMQARNLHMQLQADNKEQQVETRTKYLASRPPDSEIDAIERSEFVRQRMGLDQHLPQDPQQRAAVIANITQVARARKQNATYWLGLMYYELGNYPAAVEWLSERTIEAVPPSRWLPGARYNLARCYEQLGDVEAARRWLESDAESPQRPGNLLRAKWLSAQAASPDADPAKKDDSEP